MRDSDNCHKCGKPLRIPTIRTDLLEGGQKCPFPDCHALQPIYRTVEEWLVEVAEDIEILKNEVKYQE